MNFPIDLDPYLLLVTHRACFVLGLLGNERFGDSFLNVLGTLKFTADRSGSVHVNCYHEGDFC